MGLQENNVWNECRIECGIYGAPLYRNLVGFDHDIKRPYGLKVGSADGIGIMPIIITLDMVGKLIGAFLSVETKATTRPTADQWKWHNGILERGGISVIARGPKDIPDPKKWEFKTL